MATKGAIAARKAQAIERLSASMNTLSERLDVEPVTTGKRHRDPVYAQMQELEALADWSERIVGAVGQALDGEPDAPDESEITGSEEPPVDAEQPEAGAVSTETEEPPAKPKGKGR